MKQLERILMGFLVVLGVLACVGLVLSLLNLAYLIVRDLYFWLDSYDAWKTFGMWMAVISCATITFWRIGKAIEDDGK